MHRADCFPAIVAFMRRVGVPVEVGEFGPAGFLPGVTVHQGGFRVDPSHLVASGDLLHEAGHMAILPAALRPLMGDNLQTGLLEMAEKAGIQAPGLGMTAMRGEGMAIAWSYAALLAADLPADCIFFPGSYTLGDRPEGLLALLAQGNTLGVDGLARLGMTGNPGVHRLLYDNGLPPFPAMARWLAD